MERLVKKLMSFNRREVIKDKMVQVGLIRLRKK